MGATNFCRLYETVISAQLSAWHVILHFQHIFLVFLFFNAKFSHKIRLHWNSTLPMKWFIVRNELCSWRNSCLKSLPHISDEIIETKSEILTKKKFDRRQNDACSVRAHIPTEFHFIFLNFSNSYTIQFLVTPSNSYAKRSKWSSNWMVKRDTSKKKLWKICKTKIEKRSQIYMQKSQRGEWTNFFLRFAYTEFMPCLRLT